MIEKLGIPKFTKEEWDEVEHIEKVIISIAVKVNQLIVAHNATVEETCN